MKKFHITVNGTAYEVDVEEIGAAAPVAAPAAAPAAAPVAAAPVGGTTITCPMPGTIIDIKVAVGDTVAEGQVLLIFEAMKMEQEIKAPADGTVASVNISQGATMNQGDLLVSLN